MDLHKLIRAILLKIRENQKLKNDKKLNCIWNKTGSHKNGTLGKSLSKGNRNL